MGNKVLKTAVAVFIALAIAAASFVGGYAVSRFTRTSATDSFDWVVKTIRDEYYEEIPEREILRKIMQGGITNALDIYSDYYTKEEYQALNSSNSGSKSGLGITYEFVEEGDYEGGSGVLIADVLGNSPAWKAGIRRGVFIKSGVSGEEVKEFKTSADFSSFISAQPDNENFTLVCDRDYGGKTQFTLAKSDYTSSYCSMYTAETTYSVAYGQNGGEIVEEAGGIDCLPAGAAYMRISQFYGNAVQETASLMECYNSQNCTSLILDLRGNGGGYVNVMCGISGIFTGQLQKNGNLAMSARYRNGKVENYAMSNVTDKNLCLPAGAKVSVLADNGTASASEALIGVLLSYGVIDYGDIYISEFSQSYLDFSGTVEKNCRTYGKGIMQTTFTNPSTGEALKLTTAKIYWPNGECIHGTGLIANNEADQSKSCNALPAAWDVTYGDEQLALAVQRIYG